MMYVMSPKIVKVEKGIFVIEYKTKLFGETKTIDQKFKSATKAKEWINKNLIQIK